MREVSLEQGVQVFAAVTLLVIGISHLARPRAWVSYFQDLAARGVSGAFLDGLLSLTFGGIIVGFHNVWQGPAVVLTVVGWAQVLKGLGRFVAPQAAARVMAKMSPERAWLFRVGGAFALLLSGYFWWLRLRT